MGKVEVNNEIILLRQPVRQARICVVNKLIREAKKLRSKQGNEKQLEKNKRKADKLLKEVYALKQIKDDEISKFGILNFDNLKDVLQGPSTDDKKRVTAKVASYKTLSARIAEFKEKFPDYQAYLNSEKKKKRPSKKQKDKDLGEPTRESQRQTRRVSSASSSDISDGQNVEEIAIGETVRGTRSPEREIMPRQDEELVESPGCQSEEDNTDKCSERDKGSSLARKQNAREDSNGSTESEATTSSFKVIGEQATVKRFTDILRESNGTDIEPSRETNKVDSTKDVVPLERKMDDFFVNPDEDISQLTTAGWQLRLGKSKSEQEFEESIDDAPKRRFGKLEKRFSGNPRRGMEERPRGRGRGRGRGRERGRGRIVFNSHDRASTVDVSRGKRKEPPSENRSTVKHARSMNSMENESLHPSWAARKKQQEVMKQGFQGKKIVFDEK